MIETIKGLFEAKVALCLFLLYTLWWVSMHLFLPNTHFLYELYGLSYGVIALWGGIWGVVVSLKWGGMKSVMGKSLLMFALGLFCQEFGQIAYSYYIFVLHIDIPYPSMGDIGFFGTIPFYIYGAWLLGKASGVKFSLNSVRGKLQVFLIPILMLSVAYFLFLKNYPIDLSKPLETFFNFGYPMGQAIYISIGILTYSLTRNLLGGIMRAKILFIVIAFGVQFLSDYLFIYFQNAYYPGHFIDYMYTISYFIMAIGILQLKTVYISLRHGGK